MTPSDKIRAMLGMPDITQEVLAERLDVAQSSVNRWSKGLVDPKGASRDRIDELYQQLSTAQNDSTLGRLPASLEFGVRLVGKAGAGPEGEVIFNADEQDLGYVEAQSNSTEETVALQVEGDSMRGIANDGWLVYYDDQHQAPDSDLFGELCVVGLENERVLVKFLQPGRGDGLYDLESMNAPTMRDVVVRWAAPVTNIVPRKTAKKMMKADPTLGLKTARAR